MSIDDFGALGVPSFGDAHHEDEYVADYGNEALAAPQTSKKRSSLRVLLASVMMVAAIAGLGFMGVNQARANTTEDVGECVETDTLEPGEVHDGWGNNTETGESCQYDVIRGYCQQVDPNDPHYGWNGAESCRLELTDAENDQLDFSGYCLETSETPVAGWGFNPTTGESCRLYFLVEPPCVQHDPNDTVWGWNGTGNCRLDATEGRPEYS